ncbi:MAG: threonine/serine dehydratase [Ekhidna sp.]|nr:threonine/serine dehydratase [Ekhidna sp.]MBC6425806.1 threonine/serine dehydratase [Ekhidna sp.]
MLSTTPTFSDIKRTHQRISKYIFETPVLTSANLDKVAGCNVFFKCENFQKVGAFKMRGAANKIFAYRPEERMSGFACHSSGNHGQAVAMAARLAGSKAYVVMPKNTTKPKIDAVVSYGAEVVLCEPNEGARSETCKKIANETGAIQVHPFDDYEIIAGQGTAAKELIEQIENLDAIVIPVGGGGLAAGTALVAHYIDPLLDIYLSEPKEVDDTYQSLRAGKIIPNKTANTIADGLRTTIGEKNFEVLKEHVEDCFTVTEEEIISAMKLVYERMKIVIEPSCAVPFAALLKNKENFSGKNVGIILTGGNVDLSKLPF